MTELNDDVCDKIDLALNDLLEDLTSTYPADTCAKELFLCLVQLAAEIASANGANEQEFTDGCQIIFKKVAGTLNPAPAPKKLDPSLN